MLKPVAACLFAVASFSLPAIAQDALLSRLVGEWTGRGTMKLSATSEPERVFCKVSNSLSDSGNTLRQSGRCSLASNSGPISGSIASVGSNLYSGSLDSLASKGPASLAGSGLPNRIELNADYTDARDGSQARALITLQLTGAGYTLSSTRINSDGSRYVASDIRFTQD
jgi:hypothetical protein